jgi:antitoxin component YwqK of YwqJK toxin-antitoxin module
MRKFLLPFTFLLFLSCGQQSGDQKSNSDNPNDSASRARQKLTADSMKKKNPMLIMPPDSVYTGDYVDRYANGIVKFRGQFRFGLRHGQWMSFYPDGTKWSELHYDKGLRHGPNITYYPGSIKRYEGFYKHDKQDSVWMYYDSTGAIVEKLLYKDDRVMKKLPTE